VRDRATVGIGMNIYMCVNIYTYMDLRFVILEWSFKLSYELIYQRGA
jgi:hypothetical protein